MSNVWTPYPEPNITGFYPMLSYANSVTNDMFGMGLSLGVWVILFVLFRRSGDMEGLTAASFISVILSGIMRSLGMVSDIVLLLFLVLTAVGIYLMHRRQ